MLPYKVKELSSRWDRLVLYWYFPLQALVYFTKMLGRSVNNYVGIPLNLLFILLSFRQISIAVGRKDKNEGDILVFLFLFYLFLSTLWTIIGGFQIECITESFKLFVIPFFFYFWGRNSDNLSNRFYSVFVWTCFVSMFLGLVFYFTMPSFYATYLLESYQNSWMRQGSEATADMIIDTRRFSSFFSSSYSVCFFAVSSLAIVVGARARNVKERLIGIPEYNNVLSYIISIVLVVSSILSLQRIAMVYSLVVVSFYILYSAKMGKTKSFLASLTVIVTLFIAIFFYMPQSNGGRNEAINENLISRLNNMDFKEAMGERSGQYNFVAANIEKYIIAGSGFGSAGTRAVELGHKGITDGEYVRLFAELGSIGCFILILLIIKTYSRGFRQFKLYNAELVIITFFLLSGIGANSLSMNLWSGIFWYSVGRVWNNQYKVYNLSVVR